MKKVTFKDIFIPTFSLFLICLIITAALAFTNAVTKDKINENDENSKQASMLVVVKDAKTFEEVEDGIFKALDEDNNVVGYAISTVSNGYGGQIKVMTGIKDGEILGIDVYYNDDETPGLGKNTSNESFTQGFVGLLSNPDLIVNKDYSGEGQSVDAVTSATISSRAVIAAVNEACEKYQSVVFDTAVSDTFAGGEQ